MHQLLGMSIRTDGKTVLSKLKWICSNLVSFLQLAKLVLDLPHYPHWVTIPGCHHKLAEVRQAGLSR